MDASHSGPYLQLSLEIFRNLPEMAGYVQDDTVHENLVSINRDPPMERMTEEVNNGNGRERCRPRYFYVGGGLVYLLTVVGLLCYFLLVPTSSGFAFPFQCWC